MDMDMDMGMGMERERANEVQRDLIHQLESIREEANRALIKLMAIREEGKLIPTDGSVYGLLGLPIMAAVKNEAEYNVLTKRIVLEERLQKRSKIKD